LTRNASELDPEQTVTTKRILIAAIVIAAIAGLALAPLPLPDGTRIASSIVIARPPDAVFDYVTTPANWPKWHPASAAVSGATDHSLAPGEKVTEDFVVAGRKGRVVWTVRKRDAPREWIIKGDIDGREAGVITYALTRVAEGTRFDRELVYGSPNLLFAVLNRVSVRARVEAESTQAVQNLKRLLEEAR
jgi:uncharacterized protein YndB with AHSA1/START domain